MQVLVLTRKHLLIALVIALVCIGLSLYFTFNQIATTVARLNRTVVIDAGHGSVDPGANYQGLKEKDINLQVAFILKELLEASNIKVVMTRTNDSLYNQSRREDIIYRGRLTNEVRPDAFISIHVNKFPTAEPFGGQAYYATGEPSKLLAELVQNELKRIQPNNYRQISRGDYYVLNKAGCPAILVEIGFISNPVDRKRMTDAKTQREIATAIKDGLLAFFNEKMPASRQKKKELEKTTQYVYKLDDLTRGFDLYFTHYSPQGEYIVPVHHPLSTDHILAVYAQNTSFLESIATEAVQALITGPDSPDFVPVLPASLQLLSLTVTDGVATVDFSQDLISGQWGGAGCERLSVEAIVKTLTSFHGIDSVQILIEGEPGQTIGGHIYFDEPLTPDMF